jgi:hypothetical protein
MLRRESMSEDKRDRRLGMGRRIARHDFPNPAIDQAYRAIQ